MGIVYLLDAPAGAAEGGSMKCKYEGAGVLEGRCVGTKEVDPCIGYEKCSRFRGDYQSNADHIRSMTDEELARFLAEVENRRSAAGGGAIWKGAAHALQWLRQPVKEEPYE